MKDGKMSKSVASSGKYGHNKLLSFAESSMSGDDSLNVPSQKALGGSHNVAMAVLSEQSRKFKQQQKERKLHLNVKLMVYQSPKSNGFIMDNQ